MNFFDNTKKYVNGPVNAIRLEGFINKKKIIYIFFDYHFPVYDERKCQNFYSININRYIYENLLNADKNKNFDFLMEIRKTETEINKPQTITNDKYINNIYNMFLLLFKKDGDGKTINPEKMPNIRLHYGDIRDIFKHNYDLFEIQDFLSNSNISVVRNDNFMNTLIKELTNCLNDEKKLIESFGANNIEGKLFDKMKNKYSNESIKRILSNELNNCVESLKNNIVNIDDLIKYITLTTNKIDDINKNCNKIYRSKYSLKYYNKIIKRIIVIDENDLNIKVTLMDIYLLRRFLDKDYITNAISYTGAAHSIYYLSMLINKFDFKITHVANKGNLNIDSLTEKIKNKNSDKLFKYICNGRLQCCDMTSFPTGFE